MVRTKKIEDGDGDKKQGLTEGQLYAQRLKALLREVQRELSGGGRLISQDAVWAAYRDLLAQRGRGDICAAKATFAPWIGGGETAIKGPVTARSELSLAIFIQSVLAKKDPRWAHDPNDLDASLNTLRDLLRIGPDAEPDPARWRAEDNAAKILAEASPKVADLARLVGTLGLLETIEAIQVVLDHQRSLTAAEIAAEVAEPEEPPCNPDNAVWVAISALLGLDGGITPEVVAQVATTTRLEPARTRDILCGETPTADEIEHLSQVAGIGAKRFGYFLRVAEAELMARAETQA
jgi:hypothetical protein